MVVVTKCRDLSRLAFILLLAWVMKTHRHPSNIPIPIRRARFWLLPLLACLSASTALAGGRPNTSELYRAVLVEWASAPGSKVSAALVELESTAPERKELLDVVERQVLEPLLRKDPGVALPLAWLHAEVYRRQLVDPRQYLAQDSLERVRWLVRRYGERLGPEAEPVAARFWASLGFLTSDMPSLYFETSEGFFQRAIRTDPDGLAAYLGVAFTFERRGHDAKAAEALEEVLARRPDHAEARLRLAMVERRRGHDDDARTVFEALARGDVEPWIRRLAFQAVAGLHIANEDLEEGRRWLDEGLGDFPDDPRLEMLRALAGDDHRAATQRMVALAEGWQEVPPERLLATPPSPRLRYDLGPLDDRRALLSTAETDLVSHFPSLRDMVTARGFARIALWEEKP